MPQSVVEFLAHIALTAIVCRSYVRYAQQTESSTPQTGSANRSVILVVGGFICLSFILATLSKLAECLR